MKSRSELQKLDLDCDSIVVNLPLKAYPHLYLVNYSLTELASTHNQQTIKNIVLKQKQTPKTHKKSKLKNKKQKITIKNHTLKKQNQ